MPASHRVAVDEALEGIDFEQHVYQIEFDTTLGPIRLELFPDRAPGHVRNMIGLTKIGFYDGVLFHRVIDGFVIQAGCPYGKGIGGPGYTIPAEFNPTKHVAGILSMARLPNEPDSAGSQFFLCLSAMPAWDNQYTVFGKTADAASLETVQQIGKVRTRDQRPLEDVKIKHARVIVKPKA